MDKQKIIVDTYMKVKKDFVGIEQLKAMLYAPNPDYLQRVDLGKSTVGVPRMYPLWKEIGNEVWFPRGVVNRYLNSSHYTIVDKTSKGHEVDFKSKIQLREKPENQIEFFNKLFPAVRDTYGAIGQAGCGYGKEQPNFCKVLTPTGWKLLGDIKVGDSVIGRHGRPVKVIGVFPQGVKPYYKITFNDGTYTYSGKEHIWRVQTGHLRQKNKWVDKTLKEIMDAGLFVGDTSKEKRSKWFIPMCEPIQFERQPVEIHPYVLGCLIADGSLSIPNTVKFSNSEKDILDKFQKLLPNNHILVKLPKGTDYKIQVPRKNNILTALKKYGLLGKKATEKFIPEEYLFNDIDTRLRVLQGLFDCDGSIYSASGGIEYSTSSKKLAEDVQFLVESFGGTCKITSRIPTYTYKGEKRKGAISYRLFIRLPNEIKFFTSKKHNDKYKPKSKYNNIWRAIRSIEYVGEHESTCILVDDPEHLYLTDHCIVTHNTVISLQLIAELKRTALIIVHKTFLVNQWKERILTFYDITEDEVGIVQQDRCEYKGKKIVIALVQSLLSREYPKEFYEYFGTVAIDECHRFGSETFRDAIVMFPARYRIGVTATPYRKDKQEIVFFSHIGEIACVGESRKMKPIIQFVKTPVVMDSRLSRKLRLNNKTVGLTNCINYLAKHEARNRKIAKLLIDASQAGRKILVLSGRREHLETLRYLTKIEARKRGVNVTVAFYVGGMSERELKIAENHQILLGTYAMAKEGLDIPSLDTLFLVTPISDIEQAVGRILRVYEGKKEPMVVDFIDNIGICQGLARKRAKEYRRLGYLK